MELKTNVPLEEALVISGTGWFTYLIMVLSGMVDFAAYSGIQLMSVVIPAASCDLGLTTYQKGALTTMVYAGMIMSSQLWGFLADQYGRRRVMQFCSLGSIFVCLLMSLSPNVAALMVGCVAHGLLLAGVFTPVFVYVSECCPLHIRARALVICCAVSSLANVYLPGTAWLIMPLEIQFEILGLVMKSWRFYIAHLSIPSLVAFLILRFLPETPKYLLGQGYHDKTMKVLNRIHRGNNSGEPLPIMSVCLDLSDTMPAAKEDNSRPLIKFFKTALSQTRMIFKPPYLKYTVLSCILNVAVIGVFNTVLLWFPEMVNRLLYFSKELNSVRLCDVMGDRVQVPSTDQGDICRIKDDVFIVNIVTGILQTIAYCVFSLFAAWVSKKRLVVGLSVLTTLSCGMVIFANNVALIIVSLGSIVVFLVVIFPIYISMVVDFFPTSLRTNASSIIMLCGRISSMLGSQMVGLLYNWNCELAYPILTFLLVCMTVLFVILPTTRKP